jgi:hypothetical protein
VCRNVEYIYSVQNGTNLYPLNERNIQISDLFFFALVRRMPDQLFTVRDGFQESIRDGHLANAAIEQLSFKVAAQCVINLKNQFTFTDEEMNILFST